MKPTALGISASPHKDGKVETLMQEILSASRLPSEIIRLHEIDVGPCTACNGCVPDNVCVLDDDWNMLKEKILQSGAIVLGSWVFSGMVDSATKAVMERFWSLRHHKQLARGRVGAVAMAGANPEIASTIADALLGFMRNNGMAALGKVAAAGANPCLGCKDALDACEYSAVVAQYGMLDRPGLSMYNPIENQLKVLKSARVLGQRLGHKVNFLAARGFDVEPARYGKTEGADS